MRWKTSAAASAALTGLLLALPSAACSAEFQRWPSNSVGHETQVAITDGFTTVSGTSGSVAQPSWPAIDLGYVPGRPRFQQFDADRRPYNAFDSLPAPHRIGTTFSATNSYFEADGLNPLMVAVFTDPAQFRWTTDWSDPTPRATAVIYEGMRVEVQANGMYEASFVVEAPRTAVVLRLQFALWERIDGRDLPRGTITLPPIVLEPDLAGARHQASHSYLVRRSGYSHLLNGVPQEEIRDYRITRSGSAQFGFIPEP